MFKGQSALNILEADPDLVRRAEVGGGRLAQPGGCRLVPRWGGIPASPQSQAPAVACASAVGPQAQAQARCAQCKCARNRSSIDWQPRSRTTSPLLGKPHPSNPQPLKPPKACDVPLEPVYTDSETGALTAPSLQYKERRTEWQAYIDRVHHKQD